MYLEESYKVPRDQGDPISKLKHAITVHLDDAVRIPGRRSFFEYLDVGVTEGTEGKIKIQYVKGKDGELNITGENATGWHYHDADWQWIYLVKGELEILFEDGTRQVIKAGSSSFMPGFVKHNEVRMSGEIEGFEIISPAKFGTFPCDVPEAWAKQTEEV